MPLVCLDCFSLLVATDLLVSSASQQRKLRLLTAPAVLAFPLCSPAGFYSAEGALGSCTACPAGQYNPSEGLGDQTLVGSLLKCLACPAGSLALTGSASASITASPTGGSTFCDAWSVQSHALQLWVGGSVLQISLECTPLTPIPTSLPLMQPRRHLRDERRQRLRPLRR